MLIQVISSLFLPTLTSNIVNNGIAKKNIHYIIVVGIEMIIFSFLNIVAAIIKVYSASKGSQKFGENLRDDIYKKIINYSAFEFKQFDISSLVTRTTNDVNQVQNVILMFFRLMLMAPIMLLGASILAYQKSHILCWIFVIVLPLVIFLATIIFHFSRPLFSLMQSKLDKINLIFREGITGVRVIRAFNRDIYEENRFDATNLKYTENAKKVYSITTLVFPTMIFIMSITDIFITFWGSHLISNKNMEIGNMIAFIEYTAQILRSLMMVAMVFVLLPRAQASVNRINEVLDKKNNIRSNIKLSMNNLLNLNNFNTSIVFKNVYFKYPDSKKFLLKNINFYAKKGEVIGIIGKTGSGKSTLIELIPHFYNIFSGKIQLNNIDLEDIPIKDLRNQISFVPQESVLFSGTLRDNMRYGNKNVTDDEIWHALQIAQISDFVKNSDDKLDMKIDQKGVNFSGGQRQRFAIARALLKKASIYIFDESFSALDYQTNYNLRKAMERDKIIKESIVIIVDQRISSIANSDIILLINNGEVVAKGTNEFLLQHSQLYKEIADSQKYKYNFGNYNYEE